MQILAYLRGTDSIAYRSELNALFFAPNLRTHLKILLMDWFGSLRSLTAEEKSLGQRLVTTPNTSDQFLLSAQSNDDWFYELKENELPNILNRSDDAISNGVFWYLGSMMSGRATETVALLEPHIDQSALWNGRIVFSLARLSEWNNDAPVDLLCRIFRTRLRQTPGSDATLCLYNLTKSNPAGLCRALRAMLDQRVMDLKNEISEARAANYHDFSYATRMDLSDNVFGDHGIADLLEKAVKVTPDAVIEHLLPWFINTSLAAAEGSDSGSYPGDALFSFGWYDGHITEGAAFAIRMREALQWLAVNQPEKFRRVAAELTSVESLAVHRILVSAYQARPTAYVDDIVQYLREDPRRLTIGERGAGNYDSVCVYGAVFSVANEEQRGVLLVTNRHGRIVVIIFEACLNCTS